MRQDCFPLPTYCQLDLYARRSSGSVYLVRQPPYLASFWQYYKVVGIDPVTDYFLTKCLPRILFETHPLIWKFRIKKSRFTFIRLAQKCESPLFHWTCTKGLDPRYLLRKICCHVPSIVNRWYNHLLSKAMFFNSKLWISSPPWSLGWHMMSQFASRYFLLCSSLCQKKSR